MAQKTLMSCKCVYCGFEWEFYARSKADAKRMTGDPVCGKQECRDKQERDILAKLGLEHLRNEQAG